MEIYRTTSGRLATMDTRTYRRSFGTNDDLSTSFTIFTRRCRRPSKEIGMSPGNVEASLNANRAFNWYSLRIHVKLVLILTNLPEVKSYENFAVVRSKGAVKSIDR